MASILTAEDVVRRIAAECAYVDDRGGVSIRLEPAAGDRAAIWRAISGPAAAALAAADETPCPALSSWWRLSGGRTNRRP